MIEPCQGIVSMTQSLCGSGWDVCADLLKLIEKPSRLYKGSLYLQDQEYTATTYRVAKWIGAD